MNWLANFLPKAGFENNSSHKTMITHTSPAFILQGLKPNDQESVFDQKNGETLRQCSDELYKIMWYNAYQEKFSEEFLPKEFFTDDKGIFDNLKKTSSKGIKQTNWK